MINPFDYYSSISETKENIMDGSNNDELMEKNYPSFFVNRGLSMSPDTVGIANMMNMNWLLDNKLQYDFLINIVRKKKRRNKWTKKIKNDDLELVIIYFNVSPNKAEEILEILDENDLKTIRKRLEKGGVK